MLKLLLNFKTIFFICFGLLVTKWIFGKRINQPSNEELEKKIYNNVTKAIIDGYNIASKENGEPQFTSEEDDTYR